MQLPVMVLQRCCTTPLSLYDSSVATLRLGLLAPHWNGNILQGHCCFTKLYAVQGSEVGKAVVTEWWILCAVTKGKSWAAVIGAMVRGLRVKAEVEVCDRYCGDMLVVTGAAVVVM